MESKRLRLEDSQEAPQDPIQNEPIKQHESAKKKQENGSNPNSINPKEASRPNNIVKVLPDETAVEIDSTTDALSTSLLEELVMKRDVEMDGISAQEFLYLQDEIEREAMARFPGQIDTCTFSLGPLNQAVFVCLTCNPPDAPDFEPMVLCYGCSIACHGHHEGLVELFYRRDMICDCFTKYFPKSGQPCCLQKSSLTRIGKNSQREEYSRIGENSRFGKNARFGETALKSDFSLIKSDISLRSDDALIKADNSHLNLIGNNYEWSSHNFKGLFCLCQSPYDEDDEEERTMFQCEICQDWFHDSCIGTVPELDSFDGYICGACCTTYKFDKWLQASQSENINSENENSENMNVENIKIDKFSPNTLGLKKVTFEDFTLCPLPAADFQMNAEKSLFLKEDWKSRLDRCPTCSYHLNMYLNLPFLLTPAPPYEPPPSATLLEPKDCIEKSTYELLEAKMPRNKLIDSLVVVNKLKESLKLFLKPFAEQKKLVKKEDILSFFETFLKTDLKTDLKVKFEKLTED